jgi:hypothetical protein
MAATDPKGLPLSVCICFGMPYFLKTFVNSCLTEIKFLYKSFSVNKNRLLEWAIVSSSLKPPLLLSTTPSLVVPDRFFFLSINTQKYTYICLRHLNRCFKIRISLYFRWLLNVWFGSVEVKRRIYTPLNM